MMYSKTSLKGVLMLRSVVSKVFNMKIKEKIAFSVYIQRKVKCLHEMKNSLIS